MTEHKHAAILRAIADGKPFEYRNIDDWWYKGSLFILAQHGDLEWRIKPETITINGVECLKPVPQEDEANQLVIKCWNNRECINQISLFFPTEADAVKVYDALVAPFGERV